MVIQWLPILVLCIVCRYDLNQIQNLLISTDKLIRAIEMHRQNSHLYFSHVHSSKLKVFFGHLYYMRVVALVMLLPLNTWSGQ